MKRFLLFIPLLAMLCFEINIPYVGPFGNNNATYALQAKNYNRHGFLQTRFAPLRNPGNKFPDKPNYYLNHPPLLQSLLSTSFRLFGQLNWWAGRIVPAFFTIISVYLTILLAESLLGKQRSYLTLILASTMPMILVYGKLMQFEPILLPFALTSLIALTKYINNPKKIYVTVILVTTFFGFLADWPMLIVSFFVIFVYFTEKKTLKDKLPISLLVTTILLAAFYSIYSYLITQRQEILINAYLGRSILGPPFSLPNPTLSLLSILITRYIIYLTPLGFISVIYLLKKIQSEKPDLKSKILLVLFAFPALYVILFPNGSWEHPYWLFYFFPITLISTNMLLSNLMRKENYKKVVIVLILINSIFGLTVFEMKRIQTNKALWQNNFIDSIGPIVSSEKSLGTNWDFNDDLLRYKLDREVTNISRNNLANYLYKNPYDWSYFVFSCWANCTNEDLILMSQLEKKYKVVFREEKNRAVLINIKNKNLSKDLKSNKAAIEKPIDNSAQNKVINFYRKIRDFLNLEQI